MILNKRQAAGSVPRQWFRPIKDDKPPYKVPIDARADSPIGDDTMFAPLHVEDRAIQEGFTMVATEAEVIPSLKKDIPGKWIVPVIEDGRVTSYDLKITCVLYMDNEPPLYVTFTVIEQQDKMMAIVGNDASGNQVLIPVADVKPSIHLDGTVYSVTDRKAHIYEIAQSVTGAPVSDGYERVDSLGSYQAYANTDVEFGFPSSSPSSLSPTYGDVEEFGFPRSRSPSPSPTGQPGSPTSGNNSISPGVSNEYEYDKVSPLSVLNTLPGIDLSPTTDSGISSGRSPRESGSPVDEFPGGDRPQISGERLLVNIGDFVLEVFRPHQPQ